jgi:hypothetical protein
MKGAEVMPLIGREKRPTERGRAPSTGSGAIHDVGFALELVPMGSINSTTTWILCPSLKQFPKETGIWLSVLAAQDANEGLLQVLSKSTKTWPTVYAGVFAVDTLRPTAHLIRRLKAAGVAGVINFPSVSFIDGEAAAVFDGLSLGVDREMDFLQECSNEGLGIAGVTKSIEAAQRLITMGVQFLIAHGGPPTRDNADPSQHAALRLEGFARDHNVPVIPISRVRYGF